MDQKTIIQKPLNRVQIILNDDVACIDFLADLWDREPIHALERYVRFSKRENCCLLHNCRMDDLIVLVLYKAPFDLNEGDNKLMVFAYKDLRGLYGYFQRWLEAADPSEHDVCKALRDITCLLGYEWACQKEDEVQDNFPG